MYKSLFLLLSVYIHAQEVGNKSFPALIKVLHADHKDVDITKSLLETITILCTVQHLQDKDDKGFKFTDYFIEVF